MTRRSFKFKHVPFATVFEGQLNVNKGEEVVISPFLMPVVCWLNIARVILSISM